MAGKKGLRVSEEALWLRPLCFLFVWNKTMGRQAVEMFQTQGGAVIDLFKFSLLPRVEIQVLFHLH